MRRSTAAAVGGRLPGPGRLRGAGGGDGSLDVGAIRARDGRQRLARGRGELLEGGVGARAALLAVDHVADELGRPLVDGAHAASPPSTRSSWPVR